MPSAEQRRVAISVTGLDRLRGDPYQFYAAQIMRLRDLDALDADPSAAWQGEVAHEILERWHTARLAGQWVEIAGVMDEVLTERNIHPLMRGLWQPRLACGLAWVEREVETGLPDRVPKFIEAAGKIEVDGVTVHGRADRIDRLSDGTLAIVDYKTGAGPRVAMVEAGYALQLGVLGLIADRGGFDGIAGTPTRFEYWSLAKDGDDFGKITSPIKRSSREGGIAMDEFLPITATFLQKAIADWVTGSKPFTARLNPDLPDYGTYDQLMRLDEWLPHMDREEDEPA